MPTEPLPRCMLLFDLCVWAGGWVSRWNDRKVMRNLISELPLVGPVRRPGWGLRDLSGHWRPWYESFAASGVPTLKITYINPQLILFQFTFCSSILSSLTSGLFCEVATKKSRFRMHHEGSAKWDSPYCLTLSDNNSDVLRWKAFRLLSNLRSLTLH